MSDKVSDNPKDFEEEFSKIVESEDLKIISDIFSGKSIFTIKELLLVQQSLADSLSYINDLMFFHITENDDLLFMSDNIYHNLLSALYKISMDFNEAYECMIECDDEDFDEEEDNNK